METATFPQCLAKVAPFLEEARCILQSGGTETQRNSREVALYLIEHAKHALESKQIELGARILCLSCAYIWVTRLRALS
jgi:hypothetical protein